MKPIVYIYACLLLKVGGKEITGEKIADIISAAGGIPDPKITSFLQSKADSFDIFPLEEIEDVIEEVEEELSGIMNLFK